MKNLENKVIQAVRLARSDFFIIIMPSVYKNTSSSSVNIIIKNYIW